MITTLVKMSQGLIKIKAKKKTFGKLNELFFPSQKKEKKKKKMNCYFSLTNLNVVVLVH